MAPRRAQRNAAPARPPLTHFLCIPLINEGSRSQLEASLARFREEVQPQLPSQAVRPLGTMHCTLGVMSLDQQQLETAREVLHGPEVQEVVRSTSLQDGELVRPLKISLTGLCSMHEPSSTSVLYIAPQDETQRLVSFCKALQAVFLAKGLLVDDGRPLKLHATVVNTICAKGLMPKRMVATEVLGQDTPDAAIEAEPRGSVPEEGMQPSRERRSKSSIKMDARVLLDRYSDYSWADSIILNRIAICEMGAKKQYDTDGRLIAEEYKEVAFVAIQT